MQFKVPQFLDIEDKIFGPFTFREFIYLAGGAGLCFILFKTLGLLWGIVPMAAVAGFSLALAFYKPNNKPFLNMVESWFKYMIQDKLYIWQKDKFGDRDENKQKTSPVVFQNDNGNRLSSSKLKDLAWSLDVLDLNKNSQERRL